jgi:CRISPR-associated protein Csm4
MIVYLKPKSPFSKAVPRSDTLFGAICWAVNTLYGEKDLVELLDEFTSDNAPFIVSSLFPYVEKLETKRKILFFPRPLLPPKTVKEFTSPKEYKEQKKLKKAKFVSQSVFNSFIDGSYEAKASTFVSHAGAIMTLAEKDELKSKDELKNLDSFFIESQVARNTINRLTNATEALYHEPIISVCNQEGFLTGFYFLIKLDAKLDKELRPKLTAALRFLEDKGFGGNSNVGFGHSEVEIQPNNIVTDFSQATCLITLSLMHPSESDLRLLADKANKEKTFGQLERRKGFLESLYLQGVKQVWKPTLFMFTEGSVFPCDKNRQVYGQLFEEKEERKSGFKLRINGLAYTVASKGV